MEFRNWLEHESPESLGEMTQWISNNIHKWADKEERDYYGSGAGLIMHLNRLLMIIGLKINNNKQLVENVLKKIDLETVHNDGFNRYGGLAGTIVSRFFSIIGSAIETILVLA